MVMKSVEMILGKTLATKKVRTIYAASTAKEINAGKPKCFILVIPNFALPTIAFMLPFSVNEE